MITEESVEAAYIAWFAHKSLLTPGDTRVAMREALEAAAPHINAAVWDACVDEAEALGWVHDAGAADIKARNPYRNGS